MKGKVILFMLIVAMVGSVIIVANSPPVKNDATTMKIQQSAVVSMQIQAIECTAAGINVVGNLVYTASPPETEGMGDVVAIITSNVTVLSLPTIGQINVAMTNSRTPHSCKIDEAVMSGTGKKPMLVMSSNYAINTTNTLQIQGFIDEAVMSGTGKTPMTTNAIA